MNDQEREAITVPVCWDCGKPHVGRKNATDRCWCDTFGRWSYQKIEVEQDDGILEATCIEAEGIGGEDGEG